VVKLTHTGHAAGETVGRRCDGDFSYCALAPAALMIGAQRAISLFPAARTEWQPACSEGDDEHSHGEEERTSVTEQ
jgi:hypothetical protein